MAKKNLNIQLVIIDPQNDFCDPNGGSLVVAGAMDDMKRTAAMIKRLGDRVDDIHVTLDSHQTMGIERVGTNGLPGWWKRVSDGASPQPYTILGISKDGKKVVKYTADAQGLHETTEEYTTSNPHKMFHGGSTGKGSFGYLDALAKLGKHPHVVWPVHCRVGSWGWGIVPVLDAALSEWEARADAKVDYITKGNNPWTEHFGAVNAEIPDPDDASTQVNTPFIQTLETADIIGMGGEALSHCLAETGNQIAACFRDQAFIAKLTLITDAASNVAGFESYGDKFIKDLVAKGMKLSTTSDFLA